jgi:hypothetical protein
VLKPLKTQWVYGTIPVAKAALVELEWRVIVTLVEGF